MKVLITGSAGKAGRFTVQELHKAGHQVFHTDRVTPNEPLPGNFIKADLTNAGEIYDVFSQVKPQGVCHIAANPSPGGFPQNQTFHNNTMSSYHVMQAAGDFGASRLIYAGSEMATGWLTSEQHPERFPFNEEDRLPSPNAYALSKYLGEVIADTMVARYSDLSIVSLRINNIIMPDGYQVLEERRRQYPQGGSVNYWSYIDVRDVAGGFRAALEGTSSGHEVCLIAAADTCIDVPFAKAFRERYGFAPQLAAGFGDFQSAFDCSKMQHLFGWKAAYSWRQ